jgi:aminoglycoside 3-N-acetyltransferase
MKTEALLRKIQRYLSLDRICKNGEVIYNYDRWNDFKSYRKTADFMEQEFKVAGADEVERFSVPCDGKFAFADWVMPYAWDIEDGSLELLDRLGQREELLADYKAVPISIIRWSKETASEGEVFEMTYLPDAMDEKKWQKSDVENKLIFTHSNAAHIYGFADKYGAAGIVTDFSTDPDTMSDKVHWVNVWTDYTLWGTTENDRPLIGFALTPDMGERIVQRFKASRDKTLKVKARVNARFYEGETDVVSAVIKGSEHPEKEIVFYGHLYECQIDDNALAGSLFLEMVRSITEMIKEGVIERPKISIRFISGWEWIGSDYYALFKKQDKEWIASAAYDGVARNYDWAHGPLCVSSSPFFSASFADALFLELWKSFSLEFIPKISWRTEGWSGGSDNYWVDPLMGGVSNVWAHQTGMGEWHKSHSDLSWITLPVLHYQALIGALWALSIASADEKDVAYFSKLAKTQVEDEIRRHTVSFNFENNSLEDFKIQQATLSEKAQNMLNISALSKETQQSNIEDVKRLISEELKFAETQFANRNAFCFNIDREERVADNIIPERIVKTPLRSMSKLNSSDRRKADRAPMTLFLMDGKRTAKEIIRMQEFDLKVSLNVREVIRNLKLLEKAGYVKLGYKKTFSKNDLLNDLEKAGVKKGDTLLVHSSLFAVGQTENGAEDVFQALEEAVGQDGTVCMPSFAYNTIKANEQPYDMKNTLSRVGALTNIFWKRDGVKRSLHPSHGLAAKGKNADEIIRDNVKHSPYDIHGAFGKLYKLEAKIIMLGSGLSSNSTMHALEDWANLPCMAPDKYHYLDEDGTRTEVVYEKEPFHCRSFYDANVKMTEYEKILTNEGVIKSCDIGLAKSYTMRFRDLMDAGLKLIENNDFDILLCKECEKCKSLRTEIAASWKFPKSIHNEIKTIGESE